MEKVFFNWSGGKDSSFALYRILKDKQLDISYLLCTLSADEKRISMHGVPEYLLDTQAKSIGIDLRKIYLKKDSSTESYESIMKSEMEYAKSTGISKCVFGDIFLEDLRQYREKQLEKVGFKAEFPLWKTDTLQLVKEFVDLGFKAVIVSCNARLLSEDFCGRIIDHQFIEDLPKGVDPCGENGEFHSFVYDGPIFRTPVDFEFKGTHLKKYNTSQSVDSEFWFAEIV